MTYPVSHITLPDLDSDEFNYREYVENFLVEKFLSEFEDSFTVKKYYKTSNEDIYTDCSNLVQSGVPAILLRTRKEDTNEANPEELMDNIICRIELLLSCSVHIEKNNKSFGDRKRYCYVMNYLCRNILRSTFLTGVPRNRRRPFVYLGNRDIYRDDDLDIILAEYNIQYIAIK